jgi:four helix bundle protein
MASFTKFEEIEAWKTAEAVVVLAYGLLKEGPGSKDWALKDQVQRASVSIMCNISEGFESRSDRTFYDMLRRAKGSCGEVRTLAYVAAKVGYIPLKNYKSLKPLCIKCSSQIQALMTHLEATRSEIPSRKRW